MKKIAIEVNGKKVSKEIQDHTTLSGLLRDILNLTGTHIAVSYTHLTLPTN